MKTDTTNESAAMTVAETTEHTASGVLSEEQQSAIYGGRAAPEEESETVVPKAVQDEETGHKGDNVATLARLLSEAEERGYARGKAEAESKAKETESEAGMWQPIDGRSSRFLSGLRNPVWE